MVAARATIRIGELSAQIEKQPGKRTDQPLPSSGHRLGAAPTKTMILADAGISQSVAQRAEQVAAASDEVKQALADGKDLLRHATEIKVRAERRCGEMLRDMQKNTGVLLRGNAESPRDTAPTLAELGIEKHQSSRWQKHPASAGFLFSTAVPERLSRTAQSSVKNSYRRLRLGVSSRNPCHYRL